MTKFCRKWRTAIKNCVCLNDCEISEITCRRPCRKVIMDDQCCFCPGNNSTIQGLFLVICLCSFIYEFIRSCFILVRVSMDPQLRIELQTLELCSGLITLCTDLTCLLLVSNLQSWSLIAKAKFISNML